jgi:Alpha/beta hydrolase family
MSQSKPSILFVHGIWADGSSFRKVIPTLQAEGHEVIAAQHGLDTLAGDVAAAKSALARVKSPAILVGHSYGGTLITAAGTDPRVAGLRRTLTRHHRAYRPSSPSRTFFPTSKLRMDAYGCAPRASSALRATCPSRSRSLCGQPMRHRPRTSLPKRSKAPPGGRSRVGTSSPTKTAPSGQILNVSCRSGWARRPAKSRAATSRCFQIRLL